MYLFIGGKKMKKYLLGLVIFILTANVFLKDCLGEDTIYFSSNGKGIYKYNSAGTGNLIYSNSGTIGGITFDTNGNLYATQYFVQGKIIKIDSDGRVTTFASNLNNPSFITFRDDYLYVSSSTVSGSIEKFDMNGNRTTYVSGLYNPKGLAFDVSGNLFVNCGEWTGDIKKIDIYGNIFTFATGITAPEGLAFDKNGYLYCARSTGPSGFIYKFDSNGNSTIFGYGQHLKYTTGLAFDSMGNLYETNRVVPGTINKIDPYGNSTVFASGLNGSTAIAIIPEPTTISLISLGLLALRRKQNKSLEGIRK
jgi:sugar lactone lactonase YvrE